MNRSTPYGWNKTTLGKIFGNPKPKASPFDHPNLPFIAMDNIAPGSSALEGQGRFGDMKANGGLFETGDILYGRLRPYLNKVHRARTDGACSAEFIVLPRSDAVDSDFLTYLLRHQDFVNFASASATGDRPRVNFKAISKYEFSLPPEKDDQIAIADKIDELFSQIDEGERALKRVQTLVERYRQSVLKAAVTGELTRDWREKHKGQYESSETLLQRIIEARRDAWESGRLTKINSRSKKKYEAPVPPDTRNLPDLPTGWSWASMGQAGEVSGGLTKNSKRTSLPLQRPYLRVANVYQNRLELEDVHEIGVRESEIDRVALTTNDLLVVEGNGSIGQIGRVALWDGSIPGCVHQNHLIKVRFNDAALAQFALVWCLSPSGRREIERVASSTAGLHTLSISKVRQLPIPIPPERELAAIWDFVQRMKSDVSFQLKEVRNNIGSANTLRQAVLKSAFTGKLLSTRTVET